MNEVVVVGAGFAGIAAAVRATQLGYKVTLLERRHKLGGRTFSFTDPHTGDTLDNGQHLFMKCYGATLELLDALGSAGKISFQNEFEIEFRHPISGTATLRIPNNLPAPLNVLHGFMKFGFTGLRDTLSLRKLKRAITANLPRNLSVAEWLSQNGQTQTLQDVFWIPLCLAALNERPENAPAYLLQSVVNEAFFASSDGALLGHSSVGLSDLIHKPADAFFTHHNQNIRYGTHVRHIETNGNNITLHLNDNTILTPNTVICAIPPHHLLKILPETSFVTLRSTLKSFVPSPILSVNLWYKSGIDLPPIVGLLEGQMEWVFNKPLLFGTHDKASPGHLTCIASAARQLATKQHQEVIQIAQDELKAIEPSVKDLPCLRARVICEHHATQTLPLGLVPPSIHTAHPGLLLAGDWTDTGLPATIESAVRSGFQAVDHIKKR